MKHETTTQPVPLLALQAFFKLEIKMNEFIPIVKETIHGIALHELRHTSDPLFNDKHYFWLKEFLEVLEVEAQTTTTEPHTA